MFAPRWTSKITKTGLALAAAALGTATLGSATTLEAAAAPAHDTATNVTTAAPSTPTTSPYTQPAGSIVGQAAVPGGGGYWSVTPSGLVIASGSAVSYGDMHTVALARPIVGMAATADGKGYWLVASDGGIFAFGDAAFRGSTGNIRLAQPIVGMATMPGGGGYWLTAADGGIFAFGTAGFHGSTGNIHLARPVVGMTSTGDGQGYWMVANDGGIFAFGDAAFRGSTGNIHLAQPVVGMAATTDGGGYWLTAADGGVFAFGDAPFLGSLGGTAAGNGTMGIIPEGAGYWILSSAGGATNFGGPTVPASNVPIVSQLSVGADPASNTLSSPAFNAACYSGENNANCDAIAIASINSARGAEGYGPLPLPGNYEQLAQNVQLATVLNAERTSRGLAAVVESATDDVLAQQGAASTADPSGPAGHSWASIMSDGYATPLAADFGWMYDDGPGGTNMDCTAPGQAGCWGHRNNILTSWSHGLGMGITVRNNDLVLTALFTS